MKNKETKLHEEMVVVKGTKKNIRLILTSKNLVFEVDDSIDKMIELKNIIDIKQIISTVMVKTEKDRYAFVFDNYTKALNFKDLLVEQMVVISESRDREQSERKCKYLYKRLCRKLGDEKASYKLPEVGSADFYIKYNYVILEKLKQDIENHKLPEIRDISAEEILSYEKRFPKSEEYVDCERYVMAMYNYLIPAEVNIWVDKILDIYLSDYQPVMGMYGGISAQIKKLYESRGYKWYSFSELHPDYTVD